MRNLHSVAGRVILENEHVICSRRVYFSADLNSTYKTFLCLSINRKTKECNEFQGTAISAIKLHICHAFYIQQAAMFVYGSIDDHMFNFLTGFFSTSLEMFFIH